MDLSVVAAVGSFMVSERILPPKTFVMVGLGVLLSVDLMTQTHDPASLRVYRGPGLLAFSLMCAAFSLRTWRRNGVACDELIFLPGTQFYRKLSETPEKQQPHQHTKRKLSLSVSTAIIHNNNNPMNTNDMDHDDIDIHDIRNDIENCNDDRDTEMVPMLETTKELSPLMENNNNNNSNNNNNNNNNSNNHMENHCGTDINVKAKANNNDHEHDHDKNNNDDDDDDDDDTSAFLGIFGSSSLTQFLCQDSDDCDAYAPSATVVFGGGLDLAIPVLLNFHLFTEATSHQRQRQQEQQQQQQQLQQQPDYPSNNNNGAGAGAGAGGMSPKILPLIFLTILMVRAFVPPSKRRRFWGTVKYALIPFYRVNFRDELVGDILTSFVRPIQDFTFAIFYYGYVLQGLLLSSHTQNKIKLDDVGHHLEQNFILHDVLLPLFAILPLWLKYMQCVRLFYDTQKRTHIANAFKYLSASLLVIYAILHPKKQKGFGWLFLFFLAILYQIYWDTVHDWELFTFAKTNDSAESLTSFTLTHPTIHSNHHNLHLHSPLGNTLLQLRQRHLFPLLQQAKLYHHHCMAKLRTIQLREQRLYKDDSLYNKIFFINVVLRFCWMLSFIPAHHIGPTGEVVQTFSSDVHSYIGPIVSAAEVARRCLWCILRVELETLRITDPHYTNKHNHNHNHKQNVHNNNIHMPMEDTREDRALLRYLTQTKHHIQQVVYQISTPAFIKKLRIVEATVWATLYFALVYWVLYKL